MYYKTLNNTKKEIFLYIYGACQLVHFGGWIMFFHRHLFHVCPSV